MTGMALGAAAAVLAIRSTDIDDNTARGLCREEASPEMPRLSLIVRHPALPITGVTLLLFHLSNAALLPMLSMRVAVSHSSVIPADVYAAATVVISQCVMIPVALFAASRAHKQGYPLLITAALLVLPLRAAVASLYSDSFSMILVQILDGVAAGLLSVAVPGYVVKLLEGSGAALSPALAGSIL